jgi:hypothetical protein
MKKIFTPKLVWHLIPNIGTVVVVAAMLFVYQAWASPSLQGGSLTTINYQGRLVDNSNNPITGSTAMTFRLYNVPNGGTALWTEAYSGASSINVQAGLFNVLLGTLNPIPASIFVTNNTLFLGITVGNDSEMIPREQLGSAPYAIVAQTALVLPNDTVNGAMLAPTGFGSSNTSLRNFVVRSAVAPDLTTVAAVEEAIWDLRPIVGNSAQVIVLEVAVVDDVENSHFQVWPNGETLVTGSNAPFVRVNNADRTGGQILFVRCDSTQKVKYKIFTAGDASNTALSSLRVTVIGWIEPAATP